MATLVFFHGIDIHALIIAKKITLLTFFCPQIFRMRFVRHGPIPLEANVFSVYVKCLWYRIWVAYESISRFTRDGAMKVVLLYRRQKMASQTAFFWNIHNTDYNPISATPTTPNSLTVAPK